MKRIFQLDRSNPHWPTVLAHISQFMLTESVSRVLRIHVGEPTRSLAQNDRLWALLTDVSEQVKWPVDGKLTKLTPEDWKHIFTAGLKREHRVAQGLDGGFCLLGQHTSKMTVRELGDLMTLIEAFGAERDVVCGLERAA